MGEERHGLVTVGDINRAVDAWKKGKTYTQKELKEGWELAMEQIEKDDHEI